MIISQNNEAIISQDERERDEFYSDGKCKSVFAWIVYYIRVALLQSHDLFLQ